MSIANETDVEVLSGTETEQYNSDSQSDSQEPAIKRKRKYKSHRMESCEQRLKRYIAETKSSDCLSTDGKDFVHLEKILNVLNQLDEDDAEAIHAAKTAVSSTEATAQIAFIGSNFSCLTDAITALERRDLDIRTAITTFDNAVDHLISIPVGNNAKLKAVVQKANEVRQKNEGLIQMRKVAGVLFDGEALDNTDATLKRYTPEELACLKHSPMTSCEVERSFSMLGDLYRDNRECFTERQLGMHMTVHYNSALLDLLIS